MVVWDDKAVHNQAWLLMTGNMSIVVSTMAVPERIVVMAPTIAGSSFILAGCWE